MYSAYKLNKQGDNIQPWRIPFPVWNQSVVPCPVLSIAFWPAYKFQKRQIRWSGIPISFRIVHSLLWSTQSKALAYLAIVVLAIYPKQLKMYVHTKSCTHDVYRNFIYNCQHLEATKMSFSNQINKCYIQTMQYYSALKGIELSIHEKTWRKVLMNMPGESQGREAWLAAVYGVTQSRTRLKRRSSSSSKWKKPIWEGWML